MLYIHVVVVFQGLFSKTITKQHTGSNGDGAGADVSDFDGTSVRVGAGVEDPG